MSYRILDEPRPGALARVVVNPLWPLLAVMLGGAWLGWPWFVLNAWAVGSPTRLRETVLAAGGFLGNVVLVLAMAAVYEAGVLTQTAIPYALLTVTVWKLGLSYVLYVIQSRSFHLYEYYGGTVHNPVLVLVVAFVWGREWVLSAADIGLLPIVLG
jgi:hypothetical protein